MKHSDGAWALKFVGVVADINTPSFAFCCSQPRPRGISMSETDGLVCAYLRLPEGQWRQVGWIEIRNWKTEDGLLWIHFNRGGTETKLYLEKESGLDSLVYENLLAEETRPRAFEISGNLLVNLRGVNLNPGSNPEDMVSIRAWIEPTRIITARRRKLMAINDIREQISKGGGPKTSADFLVLLTDRLIERMAPVLEELDETEDDLEDTVVVGEWNKIRSKLAIIRRQAIGLRRYLSPQKEAFSRLQGEPLGWLGNRDKARLREIYDRVVRYVEDLDAIRERAAIIQDEVANRVSERMNKNMYPLTIVATILLPLGFFTGLLGVNVDGMPGSKDTPWAFGAVTAALVLLAVFEVVILRRLKWI
jgi:zinc transporter